MTRDAHLIEIDSIVLEGVDPKSPGVRALVELETRRALFRAGWKDLHCLAASDAAVAGEVAQSVERALKGGGVDA